MVRTALGAALLAAAMGCGSGSLKSPPGGTGGGGAAGTGSPPDAGRTGGAAGGAAPDGGLASPPCLPSPTITGDLAPQWSFDLAQGYAAGMKVDGNGNLVVAGSLTTGSLTLGAQTFPGPNDGSSHAFMAEIAPSGDVLWHRIFQGNWGIAGFALDAAGNIYLAGGVGQFSTSPADLGNGPLTGPGLLAKLDPQGNTIWSRGLDEVDDDPAVQLSIATMDVSPSGRSAIAGLRYGTPSWTSFVAFYDASGTFVSQFVADSSTAPSKLAFDGVGNLVVAGSFQGSLAWDPSVTSSPTATGTGTGFATKFDGNRDVVWSVALGDFTYVNALVAAGTRTYVAGTFQDSLPVGPTPVTSQGLDDLFIATIDDGAPPTTGLMSHVAADFSDLGSLALDGHGGLWALAETGAFADFGTGLVAPSSVVPFHVSAAGLTVATGAFPEGDGNVGGNSVIAVDASGSAYVYVDYAASIDLGTGVLGTGGPEAAQNLFLAKYGDGTASAANRSCPPPAGALLGGSTLAPQLAALADQTLVLSTGDAIMTMPVAGGTPQVLAEAQKNVTALLVQGGAILWANAGSTSGLPANQGSILSMPLTGGTPTLLAAQLAFPQGLAADDQNLYWTTPGPRNPIQATHVSTQGAVWKLPLTGGTPTRLAGPFDYVGPVAVANGVVVFAAGAGPVVSIFSTAWDGGVAPNGVQIFAVPSTGGTPVPLASGDNPVKAIVADATAAYWIDASSQGVDSTISDGRVRRATLDGATTDVLASGLPEPFALSLAGGTLTWCNGGAFFNVGSQHKAGVMSVAATGGSATTVVDGLDLVYACAADSAHVSWVQSDTPSGWKLLVRPR